MRVYELAKKLGKDNKALLAALQEAGLEDKTHSSNLDPETVRMIEKKFGAAAPRGSLIDTEGRETERTGPRLLKKKRQPEAEKELAEPTAAPEAAMEERIPRTEEAPAAPPVEPVLEVRHPEPMPPAEEPAPAPKTPEAQQAETARPAQPTERRMPHFERVAPRPTGPSQRPGGPSQRPGGPSQRPGGPSQRPGGPSQRPGGPSQRPGGPSQRPGGPGQRPGGPSYGRKRDDAPSPPPIDPRAAVGAKKREKRKSEKPFETEEAKGAVRPGMKRAFQAIRKIEQKKFAPGGKRGGHDRTEKLAPTTTAPRKKMIKLSDGINVKEFADQISVKLPEVMKKFMELGYMANINQPIDMDVAALVAEAFGVKVELTETEDISVVEVTKDDPAKLVPRPPVVTVMGHVDHGKTSLLDAIRKTKVIATEAGGITQHIGAYKVAVGGREIVFLDTPGHEAFTAMRARGAKATDIVVLVVAADDGVKPQTIEAIDHAKAAGVPIVVAINKIDKPDADPARVKGELAEHGIVAEDWGGTNIFAEISAKQGIGIDELLELILLQADVLELKANPDRLAAGVIIEARLDKGRGPIATLLVQTGTLQVGDIFLSGVHYGRVRALNDDKGKKIKKAGPSTPVEVLGFGAVPTAGDTFAIMDDEKRARQITLARLGKQKIREVGKKHKLTLDELYSRIKQGEIKDLNIIIKADVQGSVEAIRDAMLEIKHAEVQVRVIHSGVGGINESDVMLAAASNAIIIGFNVRPDQKGAQIAEAEGVDIEMYNVIYEAIDDVKKALEGMLEPTLKERILGRAEVRETFFASRLGTIAGCMVIDGTVSRNSDGVRLIRDNIVVYQGRLSSLKRFKEDAKDVQQGYECGIMIENYNDIKVGDVIENFVVEKVAGKL
jgi:translation initiation factor IF-2